MLPELTVTDSSEALLQGRKPPFRLLALPVPTAPEADAPGGGGGEGLLAACGYAVSEDFVVGRVGGWVVTRLGG